MSVQSSHEPESFAEAFNHSCWRDAIQEERNAQEKKKKTESHCLQGNKPLAAIKKLPLFQLDVKNMPFNNIREGGIRKNKFLFTLLQLQASLLLGILTWYASSRKLFTLRPPTS
jgi:hypothetical protein